MTVRIKVRVGIRGWRGACQRVFEVRVRVRVRVMAK